MIMDGFLLNKEKTIDISQSTIYNGHRKIFVDFSGFRSSFCHTVIFMIAVWLFLLFDIRKSIEMEVI